MAFAELKSARDRALRQGPIKRHVSTTEMADLLRIARKVADEVQRGVAPQRDLTSTRRLLNDLYTKAFPGQRSPVQFEANGFTQLQTFLSSQPDPLGAQTVAPARPSTPTPVQPPAPTASGSTRIVGIQNLDPQFEAYGPQVAQAGIPDWLAGTSTGAAKAVFDFGGGNGLTGSGVHLGNGYLLTARHVAMPYVSRLPAKARGTAQSFQSFDLSEWRPGLKLRVIPSAGSFIPIRRPPMSQEAFGTWNDWVLLEASELKGAAAAPAVRSTSSLKAGERVWIVGDKTGSRTRVATGVIGEVKGSNLKLQSSDVEGGFSGSPVFDARGQLVGLAVAMGQGGVTEVVAWDSIQKVLDAAPRSLKALPKLTVRSSA